MSLQTVVTPAGHLVVEHRDSAEAPIIRTELVEPIRQAFEASMADGLMFLASDALHAELPSGFVFWREFAQRFFHDLCGLSEDALSLTVSSGGASELPPPDVADLDALIENAPPMRGLEYLTRDVLQDIWQQLRACVLQRAGEHADGPVAFIRSVNPLWNLLGRVTFHLAENIRDPQRPFAFLATYTHRVSAKAKLQHLPLAEALKQYAGEKNQQRMVALLEPVRRAAQSSTLIRELLDSRGLFRPQAWSIQQAHRFLTDVSVMENCGLVVRVPDWWNPRQPRRPDVRVRIGQKAASQVGLDSLMDFSIELALDGEPLTNKERQQILQATDGLVLLRGKWVEVNQEKLQQALEHWQQVESNYADGVDFIEGMRMLSGVRIADSPVDGETADWSRVVAGDWLSETLQQLRDPTGVVGCEPGRDLVATLRPYQVEGVRWLWFMTRLGLGACLADDMGLGKTIQVIDLLLTLKRESLECSDPSPLSFSNDAAQRGASGTSPQGRKPKLATQSFLNKAESGRMAKDTLKKKAGTSHRTPEASLLVVPASLIGNWKSEFERFAPSLRVFYAHRSECDAEALQQVADDPASSLAGFDAVVTTYGLVRRQDWLSRKTWRLVVLDEAQAIKNAASAQARAVRELDASGRIALTGTPVENNLGELWSLFDFCCPGLLGNASQFKRFVKETNRKQDANSYGALRRLVRPYILRRMKTDPHIVPDLPDKTEMRADCGLTKKQVTLYQKTLTDLEKRLAEADGMERRGLVLATLMQLKQICNHPSQFLKQPEFVTNDSGKFQRLELICEPIIERQERVLVFTQFQAVTEPLAEFLAGVFGRPGLVLHGGVPVKRRKDLVKQFQADDGPPFFVISVKAGGTGLNLTAASHVIHFDRWWNPAVENQATDRAFRIGQKRNVLVHKFVCRGTVEERIDQMIQDKQELADEILGDGAGGEALLTEMSDRELLDFVAIDLTRVKAE